MNIVRLLGIIGGITLGYGVVLPAQIETKNLRIKKPVVSREAGTKACVEVLKADGTVAFCLNGKVISTHTSKLVAANDLCVVVQTNDSFATSAKGIMLQKLLNGNPGSTWIICSSGKIFTNVGERGSAALGTPGNISYSNYIGTMPTEKSTPDLIGSGKRIDFCDGECVAAQ